MKRNKTITLAATILTLTLGAFPRHASASANGFLWFHPDTSSTQITLSTVVQTLASMLLP